MVSCQKFLPPLRQISDYTPVKQQFCITSHPLKKVIITEGTKVVYYFYKPTGVHNCAWPSMHPYLYPNDVQGDFEVRNLSRRAANKWKKSGRERHNPHFGGMSLSGAPPTHPYIFICCLFVNILIVKKLSIVCLQYLQQQIHIRKKQRYRDGL